MFPADIGPLLGGRIHDELNKEVHPALDRVLNMAGGTRFSFPLSAVILSESRTPSHTYRCFDLKPLETSWSPTKPP